MIHHAWTVLCDRVIIDKDTNNVSLDVIEQLEITVEGSAPPVIMVPVNLHVVTMWYRDDDKPEAGKARAHISYPDGSVMGGADLELPLDGLRLRTLSHIPALPVKGSGVHFFTLEMSVDESWKEVARVPLQIIITRPPTT
jgi:hypothetical protein